MSAVAWWVERAQWSCRIEREVAIPLDDVTVSGVLHWPYTAEGIVIFAHGAGSGLASQRNAFVARALQREGLATLMVDLDPKPRAGAPARATSDPASLARRLAEVTDWLGAVPETSHLLPGYFGSSTGAATALIAAAQRRGRVRAIVARSGRPDLAAESLARVTAPALFIVGERDWQVLQCTRQMAGALAGRAEIAVVPEASHLFAEEGSLDTAAQLAEQWFNYYLSPSRRLGEDPAELLRRRLALHFPEAAHAGGRTREAS